MARAKVSRKRFSIYEISARRMSCRKCTAHIATLRVEVSTPATTWAVWAKKGFSAAAPMAAQMRRRTGLSRRRYPQASPHAHRPTSPAAASLGVPSARLFKDLLGHLSGCARRSPTPGCGALALGVLPPSDFPRP